MFRQFFITAGISLLLLSGVAQASECADMRFAIDKFWKLEKGQTSGDISLTPLALVSRSQTTTMPQLAVICRKDSNGGTVSIKGDGTEFNGTLKAGECRLIFLGGVKTVTVSAGEDLTGDEACGSFDIIR